MSRSRPRVRLAVLVPDRLRRRVGEQRAAAPRPQARFEPAREVDARSPSRARASPGAGTAGAHARDAALAVGDGAVLLAPGGGRQQQVGVGAGRGGREGFLHARRTRRARARARTVRLVGHRLRRVGAGDPQRLDLAVGGGLEHLDRGLAGRGGHVGDAPQRARPRRDAAGWPDRDARDSRLARPPTSRPPIALGWPVSENGPGAGLADLRRSPGAG